MEQSSVPRRAGSRHHLFHAHVVAGYRGPKSSGCVLRLQLVDVPPATEITLTVAEGDSMKNVDDLLGARAGSSAPASKSARATDLILDILEEEGEQGSDGLEARIARKADISANTVRKPWRVCVRAATPCARVPTERGAGRAQASCRRSFLLVQGRRAVFFLP